METMRVPVKVAKHMRDLLLGFHTLIAGLVLNDKTGKGESYSSYGGRYYRYGKSNRNGYGYGYYSDEEPKPKGKVYWWGKLIPEKWRSKIKKSFK